MYAGVALALGAAVSFGATIPLVHRFGRGVGALSTASLLYAGAALASVALRGRAGREARVPRALLPRIALVAVFGAAVAPTALAWGLQHADATAASLLLNFEAVFTAMLAQLLFREWMGVRAWCAVALTALAGCVVVGGGARVGPGAAIGLGAVLLATLAWAADNALTRPLSDVDPSGVVARKGGLGAVLTGALAVAAAEPLPRTPSSVALLACGATGYGLSLRLYMLAQRRVGAARTASVFAAAPFVGAALAWATGDGEASRSTLAAGVMFAVAVCLHLSETHAHRHVHDPVEHEHAHRHDDGHHDHDHDPPVVGVHSHVHRHAAVTHAHEHAPDLHHAHRHSSG